jgi:hypothetical protein
MASGSWPLTKTCDAIALEEIVQVHNVKTNKKLTAGWTWCQCVRLVVLDRKSISTAAKKKKKKNWGDVVMTATVDTGNCVQGTSMFLA